MKIKIVKNEARKTLTVIISPVTIGYVDYLYERYNGEKFFASGVLTGADYKEDIIPSLKEIVDALNEVGKGKLPPGEKFEGRDLITLKEDEYRLFSKNINKDGEWDKQFKVNLQSKSKDENKRFLFKDVACTQPVPEDDGWKYTYAVEIEIGVGYNEDELEKYVYSVFHRGIKVGERGEGNFAKNDEAWEGFDFEEEETKQNIEDVVNEDDLPF